MNKNQLKRKILNKANDFNSGFNRLCVLLKKCMLWNIKIGNALRSKNIVLANRLSNQSAMDLGIRGNICLDNECCYYNVCDDISSQLDLDSKIEICCDFVDGMINNSFDIYDTIHKFSISSDLIRLQKIKECFSCASDCKIFLQILNKNKRKIAAEIVSSSVGNSNLAGIIRVIIVCGGILALSYWLTTKLERKE